MTARAEVFGESLATAAQRVAQRLVARGETVAVCETAAGGLASAALLAVPGASAWFVAGVSAYGRESRRRLLALDGAAVRGLEPMSDAMAIAFAQRTAEALGADWGLAELGIAGPGPSPYGGPSGVAVVSCAGPVSRAQRVETGHDDRARNMQAFAVGLLGHFAEQLDALEARADH